MTDVTSADGGDSELAAPVDEDSSVRDNSLDEGEGSPARSGATRPSNTVLVLGAILVIVIAQLVATVFVLTSTNQVRDQSASANGLQRCLIRAQLNENQTTDPSGSAYKAAVQTCLK